MVVTLPPTMAAPPLISFPSEAFTAPPLPPMPSQCVTSAATTPVEPMYSVLPSGLGEVPFTLLPFDDVPVPMAWLLPHRI